MSDWNPINTAPTDGRDLLLTSLHWSGDVIVGGFHFGGWRDNADPISPRLEPTHWMNVPAAPPCVEEERR